MPLYHPGFLEHEKRRALAKKPICLSCRHYINRFCANRRSRTFDTFRGPKDSCPAHSRKPPMGKKKKGGKGC